MVEGAGGMMEFEGGPLEMGTVCTIAVWATDLIPVCRCIFMG